MHICVLNLGFYEVQHQAEKTNRGNTAQSHGLQSWKERGRIFSSDENTLHPKVASSWNYQNI